jgi:hypothetical protein
MHAGPPVRPCVCADDPAAGARHSRTEDADENGVAPLVCAEHSLLSEVDDTSILRTGLSTPLSLSSRLATGLSAHAPAQRAGAQRLCALGH